MSGEPDRPGARQRLETSGHRLPDAVERHLEAQMDRLQVPVLVPGGERERQVVSAMEAGDTNTKDMVKRIYVDVPEALHAMAERSVLAALEMLEAAGRVKRTEDVWSLV